MTRLLVEVTLDVPGWTRVAPGIAPALTDMLTAACALDLLADHLPAEAEISLVLTDDAAMQRLNADWRDQDKPTNVLSFPQHPDRTGPGPGLLGDIVLALETCEAEAADLDRTLVDHSKLLTLHGLLHLLGHDHQSEAEAERMEGLEQALAKSLALPNPYPHIATDGDRAAIAPAAA